MMAIPSGEPLEAPFELDLPLAPYPGLRPFDKHDPTWTVGLSWCSLSH